MNELQFGREIISRSLEETQSLAEKFYRKIAPEAVVALYGPLGSGKTTFIRGVAAAAGIDPEEVHSPSFTMVNEYPGGSVPIFHFDLYRTGKPEEFYGIGGDEYLSRGGLILIEWAERGEGLIPENRFEVHLTIVDEHTRRFVFSHRE